jgi:hypothetical protein
VELERGCDCTGLTCAFFFFPFFFAVVGFELSAYTLSHSTSPVLVKGVFEIGFPKLFAGFEQRLVLLNGALQFTSY